MPVVIPRQAEFLDHSRFKPHKQLPGSSLSLSKKITQKGKGKPGRCRFAKEIVTWLHFFFIGQPGCMGVAHACRRCWHVVTH